MYECPAVGRSRRKRLFGQQEEGHQINPQGTHEVPVQGEVAELMSGDGIGEVDDGGGEILELRESLPGKDAHEYQTS